MYLVSIIMMHVCTRTLNPEMFVWAFALGPSERERVGFRVWGLGVGFRVQRFGCRV